TDLWSYEDELLDDLHPDQAKRVPVNAEHSIAWVMWHIARIEDVAMNMLVAGEEQILLRDGWQTRLAIRLQDTGNAMPAPDVVKVSAEIDFHSLRAYRIAVGRQTRTIVRGLTPQDLGRRSM
ncbi:MAG: DinB family protein, partial [Anaerolineales bacterium]|nr:DinB family protein [Anaerolineales bacterium]